MSTMTHETFNPTQTVAGVPTNYAGQTIGLLQERLVALLDLELTLKHVHWNVTGPNFIAVHEMLDEFTTTIRDMVDDVAERTRTMGGTPSGLPGSIVEGRNWKDYPIGEAPADEHLRALDDVFDHVILNHRRAIAQVANLDPITEDLLIGQTADLEQRQWFVRSFLRDRNAGEGTSIDLGRNRRKRDVDFGSNGTNGTNGHH